MKEKNKVYLCPVCGKRPTILESKVYHSDFDLMEERYTVSCVKCKCSGTDSYEIGRAIVSWNRRVENGKYRCAGFIGKHKEVCWGEGRCFERYKGNSVDDGPVSCKEGNGTEGGTVGVGNGTVSDSEDKKEYSDGKAETVLQSEMTGRKILSVATDFDGCLCKNVFPEIGEPNKAAIEELINRRDNGWKIILWTCRVGDDLAAAVKWCKENGLEFDAVNENIPEMKAAFGNDTRKVYATEYWDDRAVNVQYGMFDKVNKTFTLTLTDGSNTVVSSGDVVSFYEKDGGTDVVLYNDVVLHSDISTEELHDLLWKHSK